MRAHQHGETTTESEVTVVFTCEWCGERVEIASGDAGPEIADVQAFLAQHRQCIHERVPQQRR